MGACSPPYLRVELFHWSSLISGFVWEVVDPSLFSPLQLIMGCSISGSEARHHTQVKDQSHGLFSEMEEVHEVEVQQ